MVAFFVMIEFLLILALINPVQKLELDLSLHLVQEVNHQGGNKLDRKQLQKYVIKPTLTKLGLYTQDAERLLVMIAAHESVKGYYIVQTTGQAKGIYQMEDATHDDILRWLKAKKPEMYKQITSLVAGEPTAMDMVTNLAYATAMARAFFLRFPEALPTGSDDSLAAYAKKRWNTYLGKATASDYLKAYRSWK